MAETAIGQKPAVAVTTGSSISNIRERARPTRRVASQQGALDIAIVDGLTAGVGLATVIQPVSAGLN
jgi:hypothetical protein